MVERSEHLGLPPDALPGRGQLLGRAVQRQPLERDLVAVGVVDAEVDDAHAAPADARGPRRRTRAGQARGAPVPTRRQQRRHLVGRGCYAAVNFGG